MIAQRLKLRFPAILSRLRTDRLAIASRSGCVQLDPTTRTSTQPGTLLWLLAAAAVLIFFRLDATGLWAPDEPRFAQVAEEMRVQHHGATDLLVLRLNGEP